MKDRLMAVIILLAGAAAAAEQPANYISIGNSFSMRVSYGKSAIGQVANIAELTGRAKPAYTTNVFLSNRGGSHLYDHLNGIAELPPYWWSDNGTNRGIVWNSLPAGKKWDFVIIQGYNDAYYDVPGSYSTNQFPTNVTRLYQLTADHSPDVIPVLYETWAYSTNGSPNLNQQDRRSVLYNAYQKSLAAVTNAGAKRARVAHVGEAFARMGWEDSLYEPADWYHPSYSRGSLLIGMVLYAAAYNDDLSDMLPTAAVSNLMNYMESGYDLTGADWTQLAAVADSVTWPNGRVILSTNTLYLPEGSSNTFQACLSCNPSGTVQVAVNAYKGSNKVTVVSGTNLTFDGGNWDQWQTVTVSALQDGDTNNEDARLELVTQTMGSRDLWAQVQDDGILTVYTNSLTVASAHGAPNPAVGTYQLVSTQLVACSVGGSPVVNGLTSIVCTGWALTGNDPVSGTGTNFSLTLTNHATLTWLWITNVQAVTTNTLTVVSAYGQSDPAPGIYTYTNGVVNCSITNAFINGGTQYVCAGWSLTGNDPVSGTGTGLTVTLTNNAVLTWLWKTNFQFISTAGAHGSHSGSVNGWYPSGGNVMISAAADPGYAFAGWSGDVTAGNTNDNPLTLTMDRSRTVYSSFRFMTAVATTNILRLDFGLTNAPVETDGGWQEFSIPSTTAFAKTNKVYTLGTSTVTVAINSGYSINGRDRGNPAADSGSLTYSSVYRDLIQSTTGGSITMSVAGLRPSLAYTVRVWIYDYGNASGAIFTNKDITAGRSVILGTVTNNYTGSPPTNNMMNSVGASVISHTNGTLEWLIQPASASQAARINGLEILEIVYQEIPVSNSYTLALLNTAGGSVSPAGGTYSAGSAVQISAVASSYYHFVEWICNPSGPYDPTNQNDQIIMTTNKILTAVFAETLVADSTPQAWLAQYGLATNDAGALSDTDVDGVPAWQEYIAGTLPTNAASVFAISSQREVQNGRIISWPSVTNRVYSVHWSSNLSSGVWSQLSDNAAGVYTDTVHGAATEGFYRIKVRRAQ